MKEIYLDFIGERLRTKRRMEPDTGIYQDYLIENEGIKTHVILLDVRYHYDRSNNDRLGEIQL
jgi:hypothetical protein